MKCLVKTLFICSLLLGAGGCYKLNFQNGVAPSPLTPSAYQWRHGGILGLVEFSPPLEVSSRCGGDWKEVKTKQSFAQGLVSGVTGHWYTPWNAAYSCK